MDRTLACGSKDTLLATMAIESPIDRNYEGIMISTALYGESSYVGN